MWHWAEAPAPQRRTKVGQTLSSVNPVIAADYNLRPNRAVLPARGHHQPGGSHNSGFVGHLLLDKRDLAAE